MNQNDWRHKLNSKLPHFFLSAVSKRLFIALRLPVRFSACAAPDHESLNRDKRTLEWFLSSRLAPRWKVGRERPREVSLIKLSSTVGRERCHRVTRFCHLLFRICYHLRLRVRLSRARYESLRDSYELLKGTPMMIYILFLKSWRYE